jgi:hypothetical protein
MDVSFGGSVPSNDGMDVRRTWLVPLLGLFLALALPVGAGEGPAPGLFHGTVYQVDTVFNFVDVIMPGGTRRFYADPSSVVHVRRKRAALVDICMGEEVRGTYRTNPQGVRTVVTIDDLTGN